MQDGIHLQFTSNRKEGPRMAACSINPSDRGAVMNNSTITQHPNGTAPRRPGNRQCSCRCFCAAAIANGGNLDVGDISMFMRRSPELMLFKLLNNYTFLHIPFGIADQHVRESTEKCIFIRKKTKLPPNQQETPEIRQRFKLSPGLFFPTLLMM